MAFKTFCDICDKEIKEGGFHTRSPHFEQKYYCKLCWTDKKNWPKIHKAGK